MKTTTPTGQRLRGRTAESDPASPSAVVLNGERFLEAADVMPLLGYTSRFGFWQAVKAAGIPFIRINQRRCIFEESALRAWLDSRRVGSVPVNPSLN